MEVGKKQQTKTRGIPRSVYICSVIVVGKWQPTFIWDTNSEVCSDVRIEIGWQYGMGLLKRI